jgi:ATP-dependent exoDNAse (exonuclease V) beta subunit
MMSIHAAKGLEFPVVVVADIGHKRSLDRSDLLVTESGSALRLRTVDGYNGKSARFEQLREQRRQADLEEERRIFHVAMTRAEERLILSGPVAEKPDTQAPSSWLLEGLVPDLPEALAKEPDGDLALSLPAAGSDEGPLVAVRVVRDLIARPSRPGPPPPTGVPEPAQIEEAQAGQLTLDLAAPEVVTAPPAVPATVRPAVSYSSLAFFARCPYRFHLQRECSLPENAADPLLASLSAGRDAPLIDPLLRGSLVHLALERLDLRTRAVPELPVLAALAAELTDVPLPAEALEDAQRLVAAAIDAPFMQPVWRSGRIAVEQQFAVSVDGDDAPLLYGVIDLIADAGDGHAVVVDYKTDRVAGDDDLGARVERSYLLQRQSYALAALAAGSDSVEVVHLYLERPEEAVVAHFTAADRAQLQAAVAERCAALAAAERPVTDRPGRYTCAGCPARGGLCSYSDRETSR